MGKIREVEKEMDVIIQAILIWPENKIEYMKRLRFLRAEKFRLEKAKKRLIARSYVIRRKGSK